MKKWFLAFCFSLTAFVSINAQNISGVINTYAAVTVISLTNVTVISSGGFSVGDKVLLIEMQGATIDQTNTANFGNITSYGNAGTYEFDTIASISGNVISFTHDLCRTYDVAGNVQLISVPVYANPTVFGTLTCQAWNGSTGGVLVFQATGTVTMNGNINVSNLGFTGGNFESDLGNFNCADANYYSSAAPNTGDGGQKGEGIAAYIINEDGSQGKQANGGGGGNPGNSGGGGGGNYGSGGNGGYEYSGCGNTSIFGEGGLALSNASNKVFMGGGGGGGYADNGRPVTAGGNGGAIVYIIANMLVGNSNAIVDTGQSVTGIASDESCGGGGAGGSVILNITNYNTPLTINNSGGYGGSGDNLIFSTACHGPGGGGGAGLLWVSGNTVPPNITLISTSGASGVMLNPSSPCYNQSFGATTGTSGVLVANLPAIPNLPSVYLGEDTTICSGSSIQLSATDTFASYLWQNGTTGNSITADSTGTYYVTVINAYGCRTTDSVKIKVKKPITFGFGNDTTSSSPDSLPGGTSDTTICPGKQLLLVAPAGYSFYLWQDNSTDSTYTASLAGKYYVTITDSFGCKGSDTMLVALYPKPSVNIGNDTTLCPGNILVLNTKGGFKTYLWQNGSTDSSLTATTLGEYKVIVTDTNGCMASDSVQINACKAEVQFPNAFTPNGEAQNAFFQGYGNSIVSYDLRIFNRWGELIFETTDINNGWDGRFNGAPEPVGVYVYEAQYAGVNGITQLAKGNITLLR